MNLDRRGAQQRQRSAHKQRHNEAVNFHALQTKGNAVKVEFRRPASTAEGAASEQQGERGGHTARWRGGCASR